MLEDLNCIYRLDNMNCKPNILIWFGGSAFRKLSRTGKRKTKYFYCPRVLLYCSSGIVDAVSYILHKHC